MTPPPADPAGNGESQGGLAASPGDRLDGWKAIASYLGRDIRTVQRWELSENLPIRRLEHKQRATAYAFSGELDAWLATRTPQERDIDTPLDTPVDPAVAPLPPPPRRWRTAGLALVLAGIAVAAILVVWTVRSNARNQAGDTQIPDAYAAFAEGRALYASRQYRDASIALERAVSRDPKYGAAWAFLGKTYGRLSQPMWAGGKAASDRAVEASQRALQLAPDRAETHIALSLAARSRGDVERWRAEAQRAIELDARSAEALALLGDSYSAYVYACNRDQNPELAESYYRRAMELSPNLVTAASNRAHNLRRMARYAECVELMNRMIKAFPDGTPMLAERGACRLLEGDLAGATEDIAPLRGNPKIAPAGALVYLGLLEMKSGRTEEGIRDLEAVLQLDQSPRAELIVAETYGAAGDIARATTHLKRAFDLDPSCATMVAGSVAFKPIRETDAVKVLLAQHGIR
jgi:tetratricopeptide (TPR) repeat protein